MASNGVEFAPTSISSVSPLSGPDGTLVTIAGAGFGATPGNDVVSIGSVPTGILRWSNTQILAIVGHGTTIGDVTLRQGSGLLVGPIFDAGQPVPYIVSPAILNMLVGQTHTVAVTDTFGTPVYGLQWVTSNPSIVSLSTDYPPVLTAVAVGSATVYAGGVEISVNVSAGSSLPNCTAIWSLPVTTPTLGQLELVPAVPSSSGVDVFAFDATGMLSAVSSDGNLISKAHLGATLDIPNVGPVLASSAIPDFQGGALVKGFYSFTDSGGALHNTHKVFRYDPTTRQALPLYTFTNLSGMDPGLYSDSQSYETIIPDTTGVVFIQDNTTVTVFNRATGLQIASISEPPASSMGHMIVAGDGNAYVPFLYITNSGTSSDLKLLRVSPDGSNANIDLGGGQFGSLYVITNGASGIAVFSNDGFSNPSPIRMTLVSNDTVISQNDVYTPPAPGLNFVPALQREDGSYIGSNNGGAVVAVGPSNTLWVQQLVPFGLGQVRPLYATSDGGMILTTTPEDCAPGDISTEDGVLYGCLLNQGLTPWQTGYGQLGTLYTLDQYGSVTLQTTDTGAKYSWTGNWYVDPAGTIVDNAFPYLDLGPSYAAAQGQNLSGTGASTASVSTIIRQAIARIAQGYLGSQNWLDHAGFNQCNIFIHDVIKEAGSVPPESDKTGMAHRIAYYLGLVDSKNYPAQAGDWANPSKTLGLWQTLVVPSGSPSGTLPPDVSSPGDVIAEAVPYSDATGHVGIIASIGHTISADSAVSCYAPPTPDGTITDSNYGFRPSNYTDPTGCRKHGLEIHAVVKRFMGN